MAHELDIADKIANILIRKDLKDLEAILNSAKQMGIDELMHPVENEIVARILLAQESDHIKQHNIGGTDVRRKHKEEHQN